MCIIYLGGSLMNEQQSQANRKVLVCITLQQNSKRLIDEGSSLAQSLNADFHILHISKGTTIFENEESSKLFQELFRYGASLGGEVHFLCSMHVTDTITSFIKENAITDLVIGAAPNNNEEKKNVYNRLTESLQMINIITLKRE